MFEIKPANKNFCITSISEIRLRLAKLQELDREIQKLRAIVELKQGWKNIDKMLYCQKLCFLLEII